MGQNTSLIGPRVETRNMKTGRTCYNRNRDLNTAVLIFCAMYYLFLLVRAIYLMKRAPGIDK